MEYSIQSAKQTGGDRVEEHTFGHTGDGQRAVPDRPSAPQPEIGIARAKPLLFNDLYRSPCFAI